MARRDDDRPQTKTPGQWTYYRGRWWRFTGTSWVESAEPVDDEAHESPQTFLRYHRDGAGAYWLQHPRTGAWHRHEDGGWVSSDSPPPDLDPEPLAPADRAAGGKAPAAGRAASRPVRLIIVLSAAVIAAVVVVLLVTSGASKPGDRPPAAVATSTTTSSHAATTTPSSVPSTVPATATSSPPTSTTTAPAGLGVERMRASGVGYGQTSRFTVAGPWDLYWSFNCGNEGVGSADNFVVNVNGYGAAAHTTDQGVNTVGAGQSGHERYTDSGTFSLTVDTNCRWNVRAVEP